MHLSYSCADNSTLIATVSMLPLILYCHFSYINMTSTAALLRVRPLPLTVLYLLLLAVVGAVPHCRFLVEIINKRAIMDHVGQSLLPVI